MTRKQEDEAPVAADGVVVEPTPSEDAVAQYKKDAQERAEHPERPVVREANPAFGGESFAYLNA